MNLLKKAAEIIKQYAWPDCEPLDKTKEFWEFNNNLNVNGVPYEKAEVQPGKWQWVVNQESPQELRDYEARKSNLATALQTRVLTEDEMQEVLGHGENLFIRNMVSYSQDEIQKRFNEAICQQFRLRKIANE